MKILKTSEICRDDTTRRQAIRATEGKQDGLNGIDYIDVSEDQRTLTVFFLLKAPEQELQPGNVRIDGGRRVRNIKVLEVTFCRNEDPERDDCMKVKVDKPGDFSTYTLCLVEADQYGRPTETPLKGFDLRYVCVDFSFKANCPSDLDCQAVDICPPGTLVEPEINYLAKDYASFRQLILDRLALIMPDWQERHIPDISITLIEMLAYVGDYLSYYQDAVATEAYLETARQRISNRRHARLVDYQMHEGSNTRTWLFVEMTGKPDLSLDSHDIYFITGHNNSLPVNSTLLSEEDLRGVPSSDYEVFEPLLIEPVLLRPGDIKDTTSLISKLRDAKDSVSLYLHGQFSLRLQQMLEKYQSSARPSDAFLTALLTELNQLIQHDTNLYDPQRFPEKKLSIETARLVKERSQVEELPLLNRLLLDDAYKQEIVSNQGLSFYQAHDDISFYTWGEQECCLPRGTTSATLRDEWVYSSPPGVEITQKQTTAQSSAATQQASEPQRELHLRVGDVLIFEEVVGPKTGVMEDADPTHRHAVGLTKVELAKDTLYDIPVVEIEWGAEDALPFPLCLSTIGPAEVPPGSPPDSIVRQECQLLENISIARGNVILVDYGKTQEGEDLGSVPAVTTPLKCEAEGEVADVQTVAGVFRPILKQAPLTFYEPLPMDAPFFQPEIPDPEQPVPLTSAYRLLLQEPRRAVPSIRLIGALPPDLATSHGPAEEQDKDEDETEAESGRASQSTQGAGKEIEWFVRRDLLESQSEDYHFVVEMDNDGFAHLRFGDGELGRMPEAGTRFKATYRIGNGLRGNVGAESITHIVIRHTRLDGIMLNPRNPFAVYGGKDPEPLAEVKLFAPHAFRSSKNMQRAITADDYARLAERNTKVQRAAATLNWIGSWYEVLVAIDPFGTDEADQAFLDEIRAYLERYRRIGHDLKVVAAQYVPLDIEMTICVQPHFLRGHVKAALLEVFSNRVLSNGRPGFFHPDNLTFGQGIALSKLVATAQAVQGVQSVKVTVLKRLFEKPNGELQKEFLPLGPMEIAQLDNDPSFPEHGKLVFTMEGGR
jgi:predicted phage baseplate assembly protein